MTDNELEPIASIQLAYAGKLFPAEQIHTFRNLDQAFPTRVVKRGETVSALKMSDRTLDGLLFESHGNMYDIYDYVSRNCVTGLLVLKEGQIVHEHYDYGNTERTRWISMSMAKSISSSLLGAAIQDGYIDSLDDILSHYLPALAGGSYEGVSIRQLLLMTSGTQWNEDQTDENSERRQVLELQIAQQAGGILRYMNQLPKLARPGDRWNYSTGETHMVGELIKATTGMWVADYLSEKFWVPLGMESDATWWLESPGGLEIAGSGISASLRDYGRFGQFILDDGIINGTRVLPQGWVEQAGGPTKISGGKEIPYGLMWWPVPSLTGSCEERAFSARGIFGQRIFINPVHKVVIVVWSARSKPMGAQTVLDNNFFNSVTNLLGDGA